MASISSKSVPIDDINELLRCSMCLETLREPRILDCFHNFCKVCLGKYVERLRGGDKKMDTFPCPTCRSEFILKSNQDVAELPSSHFIINMLEIMAIQQKAKTSITCSRCQDTAINHCASCEIFMCKKCSESHNVWFMKNHNVLGVQELGNPENQVKIRGKLYCLKHKDEVLKYYCETCKELSCIDCVVINHQKSDHSCVAVSELADKQRETLQSSCTTLDKKLAEGKEALNNICEVMGSLEKNAKTAKDQIKEQKENILKIVAEKLDERAKKMEDEVDKVYSELHGELSEQHDEIIDYLDKVQVSVSLPKNLLKRGSIEEIISSQKMIDEKMEKLESERPENFAAVNDGGIQYVPADIGNINVDEVVEKLGHVEDKIQEFQPFLATFTNLGANGRSGPTTLGAHYVGQDHEHMVAVINGIQHWTVPYSGTYQIKSVGAAGGYDKNGPRARGRGAYMQGDFELKKGDVIALLVGQTGLANTAYTSSGGGGGTFVATSTNDPLLVAGGGGGIESPTTRLANSDASTQTTGRNNQCDSACANWAGGVGGNGGLEADSSNSGGGGGGFNGNGRSSTTFGGAYGNGGEGGRGFLQGGTGGRSWYGNGEGGFGGGGGAYGNGGGAGGGGGYSGGASGDNVSGSCGGGGGSYNIGKNQVNQAGYNDSGHGYIIIIRLN